MLNSLTQQLERAAASEISQRLGSALDPLARQQLISGFRRVGADEGTIWIANRSTAELIPVLNNGPDEKAFLKKFRQPLDRGVISMVYHSGQPFCENDVVKNSSHDRTIDTALSQVTAAMIAVPLFFANRPRGVVSCVRLGEGEFNANDLGEIQLCVAILERLIDWQLMQTLIEEAGES